MKRNLKIFRFLADIEISHVFCYGGYTSKQRLIQWGWYMTRNFAEIVQGLLGIITLGLIQTYWSVNISEKIIRNQIKFYKEKP